MGGGTICSRGIEYSYIIWSGETDYSTPEAVLLRGDNPQHDDKSQVYFTGSILLNYAVYFVSGMDNKSHEQTLLVWLLFWMLFALYWKHQERNSLTLTLAMLTNELCPLFHELSLLRDCTISVTLHPYVYTV